MLDPGGPASAGRIAGFPHAKLLTNLSFAQFTSTSVRNNCDRGHSEFNIEGLVWPSTHQA